MVRKTDLFYPDRVEGGRFVTRPVLQLLQDLEGQQVEVCIRPKRRYVGNQQRGYYRGVVIKLLAMCMRSHGVQGPHGGPITDEQVHRMMAARFLLESVLVNPGTGEYEDIPLSTTEITSARMTEYIENVREWAREVFELDIPDPTEAGDVTIA